MRPENFEAERSEPEPLGVEDLVSDPLDPEPLESDPLGVDDLVSDPLDPEPRVVEPLESDDRLDSDLGDLEAVFFEGAFLFEDAAAFFLTGFLPLSESELLMLKFRQRY